MAKKTPQTITWTNERRKLSDLIPWERNPRQIQDAQAERLVDSFSTFGQVLPICISPTGDIYDGHQRRSVIGAAGQYGMDYEVDVRVASRPLTEKEREKLTVYLHKGAAGEWDWAALAEWDYTDLTSWGFDSDELDAMFAPNAALPTEFKEYDETTADDVEMCTCPKCGHEWPK